MKISNWSAIPTADGLGVALAADGCSTEVCIRVVDGEYVIRVYVNDECDPTVNVKVRAGDLL